MLKIYDIKPIVDIPDTSLYIYYGLIILILIFFIFIVVYIYKKVKNKKNVIANQYFTILKNIDFNNSKQSSYLISKYGRLLAKTQEEKNLINEIYNDLEQYKYKKEITSHISNDIKIKFDKFIRILNVS
jgi:F0F1-type ATP synthase membrane subunit b/b'